jgi:hypothetical protein
MVLALVQLDKLSLARADDIGNISHYGTKKFSIGI